MKNLNKDHQAIHKDVYYVETIYIQKFLKEQLKNGLKKQKLFIITNMIIQKLFIKKIIKL